MIRILLAVLAMVSLVGCATETRLPVYNGPEVTQLLVYKDKRQLLLLHNKQVLKSYRVGLGFEPKGDKKFEGDGRTPEGVYFVNRRNPDSRYHLSIGISYPNATDVAHAQAVGKSPGGDIFIHGRGPFYRIGSPKDWTWGCIAVTDAEMEEIYAMVGNDTPILILP